MACRAIAVVGKKILKSAEAHRISRCRQQLDGLLQSKFGSQLNPATFRLNKAFSEGAFSIYQYCQSKADEDERRNSEGEHAYI